MQYLYRSLVALGAAAIVFAFTFTYYPDSAVLLAVIALAVVGLAVFLDKLFKLNNETLFCMALGIVAGLFAGSLLQGMFQSINADLARSIVALVYVLPVAIFGYVGQAFSRKPGLRIFGGGGAGGAQFQSDQDNIDVREKILDTSVIIDGRILDIAETHFIDGPFIIPNFVLREIQLISDSPDPIKRNRGRRGLEMLNKLQQHGSVNVKISYIDYTDTREVDAKLIKLSRETGGKLVTNDFNLNKVAELQGVEVLNLNNLTNALKPVVLPGEDILIDVIKEGKDENQGIGYLEDGTMVVIENGGNLLGKAVKVNVTSIIQTAAGKMIFTRATGPAEPSDDAGGSRDSGRGERESGGGRRGRRGRSAGGRGGRGGGNSAEQQGGGDDSRDREIAQGGGNGGGGKGRRGGNR